MRRTTASLVLLVLLLWAATACTTAPEPNLPPITEEGRNTLGFKANGKVWVNSGEICNWFDCDENVVEGRLHKYPDGRYGVVVVGFYTNKDKNINQHLSIAVNYVDAPGTYKIKSADNSFMTYLVESSGNNFYQLGDNSNATITITKLDRVNNIISGQFSGTLYNYNDPTQEIQIIDGRFDTKLTYSE